ncbi:hypothetical protein RRG08_055905 [Elysia crispata]|uniref:Uncharacterized protein n=1 Tax=Elysia crispata TaxID=231223 RepID=A0AAE1CSF1_9GAST|nr:hypothetical protein RRG08_055905 [Elysia crispata]
MTVVTPRAEQLSIAQATVLLCDARYLRAPIARNSTSPRVRVGSNACTVSRSKSECRNVLVKMQSNWLTRVSLKAGKLELPAARFN